MFTFSIFIFGKLSQYKEPVTREQLAALVTWAIDNGYSYSVQAV